MRSCLTETIRNSRTLTNTKTTGYGTNLSYSCKTLTNMVTIITSMNTLQLSNTNRTHKSIMSGIPISSRESNLKKRKSDHSKTLTRTTLTIRTTTNQIAAIQTTMETKISSSRTSMRRILTTSINNKKSWRSNKKSSTSSSIWVLSLCQTTNTPRNITRFPNRMTWDLFSIGPSPSSFPRRYKSHDRARILTTRKYPEITSVSFMALILAKIPTLIMWLMEQRK